MSENPAFTVDTSPALKDDELLARINDYDALIVRSGTKVKEKALRASTRLKVIGRAGVGVDNVDTEVATEKGIVVMNTPGGNTISTAEHTFSLMLSLARHIPQAHASIVAGKWDRKSFEGTELCQKTLGIVGMGRIGGEVARRAIAFGMKVVAYDPYLVHSRARALQVELVDELTDLLTQADFITVHMPLTTETTHILNAKTIAQCKKGVRIINCARGGLVDEVALLEGLKSGQVGGAAMDVYEVEPPPADYPFLAIKNVVFTPHLGASTAEAQESVGVEIAHAISEYLLKGLISNAVNMPNVDSRMLETLRPYLALGESLGRLLAQITPRPLDTLTVKYCGKVSEVDTAPVTRTVLKGLLKTVSDSVNEINAPKLAKNLGLKVTEARQADAGEYTDLLIVEGTKGGDLFEVGGTFFGVHPRIVRLNGHSLEAHPQGVLMIMENKDRPGIIGKVGTILAEGNINVANMALSRGEIGGVALSALNLDSVPAVEIQEKLRAQEGILSIRVVQF